MAAPSAYSRRSYVGNAPATTVPLGLGSSDSSCALASGTNWPSGSGGDFLVVVDRSLNTEEKIWCSGTSGTTLTFAQRGAEGTSAVAHGAGCSIALCTGSQDADEANQVVNQVLGQSGAAKGDLLAMLSASGPNTLTRIPIGSGSQVLGVSAGLPAWVTAPAPTLGQVEALFTAKGQLLVGTGSGTGELLTGSSTAGQVLTVGGADPSGYEWASPGAAPALGYTEAQLGSPVTITSGGSLTDILATPSLAVGTWLIMFSGTFSMANTGVLDLKAIVGTATATITGGFSTEVGPLNGAFVQPASLTFQAVVTVAGTVKVQGKAAGANTTADAATPTNSYAGATGMIGIQVA